MYLKNLIIGNCRRNRQEQSELQYPSATFNRDVDRLFNDFFKGFGDFPALPFKGESLTGFSPRVNVSEKDKEIEVTAEIPGIDQSDVDVTLKDNLLTIKGEKKEEKDAKGKGYYHVERSYGSFQRFLHVPCEIETDKVNATFKRGVLKVTLPKCVKSKENVRKIEVKSE